MIHIEHGDFPRWFRRALESRDEQSHSQYYPDQTVQSIAGEEKSINLSIDAILDVSDRGQVSGVLVVMEKCSTPYGIKGLGT
ncbi:MAG: hypothetical protein WCA35_13955 [Kovacikia sp.]